MRNEETYLYLESNLTKEAISTAMEYGFLEPTQDNGEMTITLHYENGDYIIKGTEITTDRYDEFLSMTKPEAIIYEMLSHIAQNISPGTNKDAEFLNAIDDIMEYQ